MHTKGKREGSRLSRGLVWVWLAAVGAGWPAAAPGIGLRVPTQDAEAGARGNAFVATADNPSAVYYNPAGILQTERAEVQAGTLLVTTKEHFISPSGQTADTRFEVHPVPEFYSVFAPEGKRYGFGFGCYAPYGLGLQWRDEAPLRTAGLEGRLEYVTLSPVGAYQLLPGLSVAAGPTFDLADVRLRRGLDNTPGHDFQFRGHGWAAGAKVGLLWKPLEKWSVGLSYCSPTRVNFEGHSSMQPLIPGQSSSSVEVAFPQFVMGGVAYRPTTNWNIEVGADWTDWDSFETLTFKGTPVGDVPLPLNWKSSWMANAGVTRYLGKGYWVGAGYYFIGNSTTDQNFTPIVPDTDLHVGTIGGGYRGRRWSWALSGQLLFGAPRDINNGTAADGRYEFFNQALVASVGYRF